MMKILKLTSFDDVLGTIYMNTEAIGYWFRKPGTVGTEIRTLGNGPNLIVKEYPELILDMIKNTEGLEGND